RIAINRRRGGDTIHYDRFDRVIGGGYRIDDPARVRGSSMIVSKFWQSLRAQLNKIANAMWHADPIALMQFEYDPAVEQLRDGRAGLVQYRAIVERLHRQADSQRSQAARLVATIEAYLQAGDRNAAAGRALELQNLRQEASETESLLTLHEQAYANNLAKI